MKSTLKTTLALTAIVLATHAAAQVTLYEREGFAGKAYVTSKAVTNLERQSFNDRASSVTVEGRRGERWEVCEDARFSGRCVVLRPGNYASLSAMGLDNRVSSVRMVDRNTRVDDGRYAPAPVATYDARRRNNERLYQADVTSVRAVVGPPEQRCWIEREQVVQERRSNVPGTVIGAVLGGILGHQVGDGRGRDLATVGGAVAGGAVGSNVGRNGNQETGTRDVQRCNTTPAQAKPELWDVTYSFRGQDHRVQMTNPPGATVTVNKQGEPRA